MPVLRVGDEEERGNQGGVAEMALRELRDVLRPPQRHLGTRPRGLHLLAAVEEGLAGRLPGRGRTFRRRTAAFWGGVWPMPEAVRRGAPRRVRGRDMGDPERGGADRLHGAPRSLLAPRARRDERRVEVAAVESGAARRRRHRRRQQVRQGRRGRIAPHQGAEVRLPRVLPGQALHDNQAKAPGGRRAVRVGKGATPYRDARPGEMVGRALLRAVGVLARLPRRAEPASSTRTRGCARRAAAWRR